MPDSILREVQNIVGDKALAQTLTDQGDDGGNVELGGQALSEALCFSFIESLPLGADSQIITALDVLPGNGDEAVDTTALIHHEETVHGNDVHVVSIDKVGFRGELLRTWHDPVGPNLEVVVPPLRERATPYFTAEAFTHDATRGTVTCPGQITTARRTRNHVDTGWKYVFPRSACIGSPLQAQCLKQVSKTTGRLVGINDYAAEDADARQYATTDR